MITVNSISKREEKLDQKGKPCINFTANVQHDGEATNAYITSYAGDIKPGDVLDIKLTQKTSKTSQKSYWSGYWYPSKENPAPIHTGPVSVPQKQYTPEELEGVMQKCVAFAYSLPSDALAIFGSNLSAIVNTMFLAQTQRGHRPNDWTTAPAPAPSAKKDTWHWEIGDWIKAGHVPEQDVVSTVRLIAKTPGANWEMLTEAQAETVYNRVKDQVALATPLKMPK